MAVSVPIDYQNRVAADPLPQQRLRPADFGSAGETIGRALEGAGNAGREFVDRQDRINGLYDEAAVKTTLAKAVDELAPIRNTVTSARGMDTVGAKVQARASFEELQKRYQGALANPRQQRLFGDAFGRIRQQEYETYDRHEAKEIEVATVDGSKARQATSLSRAVDLAGVNDEAADSSLADALVENRTLFKGADAATLARANAETVSGFRVSVAQKLADGAGDKPGDALAAKSYLDAHAGEILPSDESKMRRAIQSDVDDAVVEAAYGEVLGMQHGVEREPTPEEADADGHKVATVNADPLRGKGRGVTGRFTDTRDGGSRMHAAEDIAAPPGTAVYPPMSGKVEKVWFDPKGGNSVLIRHPDGRVTGYAHLRNVNVDAGQSVDASTVLGGVGNTGAGSHGNHLHFTVRDQGGKRVDPAGQTWREQGIAAPSTDRADVQGAYSRALVAAKRNNLSPKQTRELLSRIDGDAARNDRLRARAEDEARDDAYSVIDKMGDGFTDVSQVPVAVRSRLAPGVLTTLRNVADANKKGDDVGATKPGGDTYYDLYEMAGNAQTQSAFIDADLYKVRGSMAKGEWNSLRKMQIDMRNGGGKTSKEADHFSAINETISYYAPQSAGLDVQGVPAKQARENKVRRAQVAQRVDAIVRQREAGGKPVQPDELRAIVRSQLAPVYLNNDTSQPIARGAVAPGQKVATSVPKADRSQIIAAWNRAHGTTTGLTEGMIARIYLDAGGGLK